MPGVGERPVHENPDLTSPLLRTALRTKARKLITAFLGPDTEGFWVCPGPEQLICLCRGLELVSPRAGAEDVLGGASLDDGGALTASPFFTRYDNVCFHG